jgi:alpha-L-rhamnosidase
MFLGERYDARLEPRGWTAPAFDDAGWDRAHRVAPPRGRLRAQRCPVRKPRRRRSIANVTVAASSSV